MTVEEFREIMEDEEFVVDEAISKHYSNEFGLSENGIIYVTQGASTDPDASFGYIIFDSSEDAIKHFNFRVDNQEMGIGQFCPDVTPTLENSDNYSKWTVKGDLWGEGINYYQCFIRLDNTILMVI